MTVIVSKRSAIISNGIDTTTVLSIGNGTTFMPIYIRARIKSKENDGATRKQKKEQNSGMLITNARRHKGKNAVSALVSGLNLSTAGRNQLNYTLGKTVYVYTFGESVYNLSVSGFGFAPCNDGAKELSNTMYDLMHFYETYNVSKTGRYCDVVIGDRTFKGYLTAAEFGLTTEYPGLLPFKFEFFGIFDDDDE